MNMRLLSLIGEVEDSFIDDTPIDKAVAPKHTLSLHWIGTVAACIVLGVVSLMLAPNLPKEPSLSFVSPQGGTSTVPVTSVVTTTTTTKTTTKTTAYEYNGGLGCYSESPAPGVCRIDMYARGYFESIASSDLPKKAWVAVYVHGQNGLVETGDVVYSEAKRLSSLGYEVYLYENDYIDYWGVAQHRTELYGMLTLEQVERFAINVEYGYTIDAAYHRSIDDCIKAEEY